MKTKLILGAFLLLLSNLMIASNVIVVSPSGNDRNRGSLKSPFKTIDRALLLAKGTPTDSTIIYLRGGDYIFHKTLEIQHLENLEIKPYHQEKVRLLGGILLKKRDIRKVHDHEILNRLRPDIRKDIRVIDFKKLGIQLSDISAKGFGRASLPSWSEIFINGKAQNIARWPNDSTVLIGKIHCTGDIPRNEKYNIGDPKFSYLEDRPSQWKSIKNAWISGYFAHGYADDLIPIKTLDKKNKTITAAKSTLYGFMTGQDFRRWFALNLLEELDLPNEYVIDSENDKLYFIHDKNQTNEIAVSVLGDPILAIENCKNVTVNGVVMEYSRGMGVYIEESEGVTIDRCTFRNLGYLAVSIGRGDLPQGDITASSIIADKTNKEGVSRVIGNLGNRWYCDRLFNRHAGTNNGVTNCEIYNVGSGGINLGGGDRKTLTPGNNYVDNCKIHDYNRIERSYKPAIAIDGVGNRISHCELYSAPSMALYLNGNNHLISYTEIYDVCNEINDQGAVYYGRDATERGNELRFCYFHDMDSKRDVVATYHDDGACGLKVFGCIYYKAGTMPVLIGGGHDNIYENNLFINLPMAIHIDERMNKWGKWVLEKGGIMEQRLHTVDYKNPPYSIEYPELVNYLENDPRTPQGNCIKKNLFYKVGKVTDAKGLYADWYENYITSTNPGFVDETQPLKGFVPQAPIYQYIKGFTPIPFNKIGCHLEK